MCREDGAKGISGKPRLIKGEQTGSGVVGKERGDAREEEG